MRTDGWPMVAAHLVAGGADDAALVDLAGLPRNASGWEVDQLLDRALCDAGVTPVDVAEAGIVVAHVLAERVRSMTQPPAYLIIRTLAALAPSLDYPGGVIGDSYNASEWLDCDCHRVSTERDDADALELELRSLPPLDVDDRLLVALSMIPAS
jgi:hypothetical protein